MLARSDHWKPFIRKGTTQSEMTGDSNLERVRRDLEAEASKRGLKSVLGVAPFREVLDGLLPVQRVKLREIAGERFDSFMEGGSFISIAFAYPEEAIDAIAVDIGGGFDLDTWAFYSGWCDRLNQALNQASSVMAERIRGISIPATTAGIATKIEHVEDYYPLVVSHRVAAELSGVGWRGKNELIVNPKYSCAIRLASIITDMPLERTEPLQDGCEDCTACLDACPFLANKDRLENYREQCRRYIVSLGLEHEVCGKCIKACYRESVHGDAFRL
ncbi:epoxyqueuosine reductase [Candidatus Bathyarchaeota archaeon]|nr:epoxyqueuosine reductase [Candidatus Bathyarchaeota archaeon]